MTTENREKRFIFFSVLFEQLFEDNFKTIEELKFECMKNPDLAENLIEEFEFEIQNLIRKSSKTDFLKVLEDFRSYGNFKNN